MKRLLAFLFACILHFARGFKLFASPALRHVTSVFSRVLTLVWQPGRVARVRRVRRFLPPVRAPGVALLLLLIVAAQAQGAVFVNEAFSGTAGATLEAYSTAWSKHPNFTTGSGVLDSGSGAAQALRSNSSSTVYYLNSGTPATAQYDVEADFVVKSVVSTSNPGIAAMMDSTATTNFVVYYTGTQWRLLRQVAGVITTCGSVTQALTAGTTYHVKLSVRTGSQTVSVNGTSIITYNDTTLTAAGKAAIYLSGADTDTTGIHVDNFTATDYTSPVSVSAITPTKLTNSAFSGYITASGGTAPYTYQWYRSTSSGFTPGAGNQVVGATNAYIDDTGLTSGTPYYYVCIVTDASSGTSTSAQIATTPTSSATVAVTSTNVYASPFNTYSDGGGAMGANNVRASSTFLKSNNPGWYCKLAVTAGTSGWVKFNLDTTALNGITAANCPQLAIMLDGKALTTALLVYTPSQNQVSIATGLSAGSHTLTVWFQSVAQNSSSAMGDRWNTPASCVKITGVEVDSGSSLAAPSLRTKTLLWFGDSIAEGCDILGSTNLPGTQDSTQTAAQNVAASLNAEVGIVGFAASGYTIAGYGNAPALYNASDASQSWNKYWAGTSRLISGLLSPAPDYIVVNHGKNDASYGASDASVTSAVQAWLAAVRTAAPTSKIFVVIPFDGSKRSAITAGFNNYNTASSDTNCYLVDLGTSFAAGLTSGGLLTNDGVHPNPRGVGQIAPSASQAMQAILTPYATQGTGGRGRRLN